MGNVVIPNSFRDLLNLVTFSRGCWNKFSRTAWIGLRHDYFVIPNSFRDLVGLVVFSRGCWNKFSMTALWLIAMLNTLRRLIDTINFGIIPNSFRDLLNLVTYSRGCWNKFSRRAWIGLHPGPSPWLFRHPEPVSGSRGFGSVFQGMLK